MESHISPNSKKNEKRKNKKIHIKTIKELREDKYTGIDGASSR
jgi:hypothetical protein